MLIILLLAIFVKQLAWSTFVPLWQTPDEQAHFGQVQLYAEIGKAKHSGNNLSQEIFISEKILGTDRDHFGNNKYTYHPEHNIDYGPGADGLEETKIVTLPRSSRTEFVKVESTGYPPLYYQLGAFVYKLFDQGSLLDRVFAVRLISGMLLVGVVYVAYAIGKILFHQRVAALTLAMLVGFAPMFGFVHSGVTSDSLFNLLFAIYLWASLKIISDGFINRYVLVLGLVIVLSYLTKPQSNIMGPILLPVFFILVVRNIARLKIRALVAHVLIFSVSIFGIAWRLFSGMILIPETNAVSNLYSQHSVIDHLRFTFVHTYTEVLPWYWGVFRWLSLGLPDSLRRLTNWATIISFLSFGIYIVNRIRLKKLDKKFWMTVFTVYVLGAYFLAITFFDFAFWQSHRFSFGIQGRYFFPVLVPQMVILLIGLTWIIPNEKRILGYKLLALGMILFNLTVFFWVIGSYYQLSWPAFFIQASQYKPLWLKYPVNVFILTTYLFSSAVLIKKIIFLRSDS